MSRIGIQEIKIPSGVSVKINDDHVEVKGPKGTLTSPIVENISVSQEDGLIKVDRHDESKRTRALHGLVRSLINNNVIGVTEGFKKQLEIHGVGYRAQVKGKSVEFNLGYSHSIDFPMPEGITINVEKNTEVTVEGANKQQVGQVAAKIRELRPPEVYKGKGIRYKGEYVARKVGKAAAGK
jgi:large subunit ribosomal protein L6